MEKKRKAQLFPLRFSLFFLPSVLNKGRYFRNYLVNYFGCFWEKAMFFKANFFKVFHRSNGNNNNIPFFYLMPICFIFFWVKYECCGDSFSLRICYEAPEETTNKRNVDVKDRIDWRKRDVGAAQRVRSNGPWGGSVCLLEDFLQVIKHHIMKTQMWLWTDPHGCRCRPSLLLITFIILVSSTSSVAFRGFSVAVKLVDIQLPIWRNSWWNRKGTSDTAFCFRPVCFSVLQSAPLGCSGAL